MNRSSSFRTFRRIYTGRTPTSCFPAKPQKREAQQATKEYIWEVGRDIFDAFSHSVGSLFYYRFQDVVSGHNFQKLVVNIIIITSSWSL